MDGSGVQMFHERMSFPSLSLLSSSPGEVCRASASGKVSEAELPTSLGASLQASVLVPAALGSGLLPKAWLSLLAHLQGGKGCLNEVGTDVLKLSLLLAPKSGYVQTQSKLCVARVSS